MPLAKFLLAERLKKCCGYYSVLIIVQIVAGNEQLLKFIDLL